MILTSRIWRAEEVLISTLQAPDLYAVANFRSVFSVQDKHSLVLSLPGATLAIQNSRMI